MKLKIDELIGQVYEIKCLLELSSDHFDYKKYKNKVLEHYQLTRNIEGYSILSSIMLEKLSKIEQSLLDIIEKI